MAEVVVPEGEDRAPFLVAFIWQQNDQDSSSTAAENGDEEAFRKVLLSKDILLAPSDSF